VLREVLPRLAGTLDVHLLGIGYRGPARDFGGATLHPTNLRGGDVFAAFAAAELAEELDARIVLLLHDFWMLHPHARRLAGEQATVVAYVPVDGCIVDARYLEPLAAVDRFVAYTEFGRRELQRFVDVPVDVIPHGVDTAVFRPLGSRPGGFVVLNANRPNERKRIDLTISGFALFARGKPADVRLRLHHAVDAAEHGDLIEQLGIADRVDVTTGALSDEELNLVYNSCAVGANTAMGEGWGLVSFEHAATGAAQVVPDSSACAELWAGSAEVVAAADTGVPGFSPLAMRTVSAEDVAAALERLYAEPEHLRELSDAAYGNATRPEYRWDAIGEQWRELVEEVLAA
jgi:glycosyltransferase involved in cell wall biosynthesis